MLTNETINKILKFRDDRNLKKFHNSKDLSIALSIEASELQNLFLWKDNEEVDISKLKEELADIFMYAILLVEKHNLNIDTIIDNKLRINEKKFPIDKSKGLPINIDAILSVLDE